MLTLIIRTDKPEAEIGLYDGPIQLAYETWTAHRQLGQTIHSRLASLVQSKGTDLTAVQAIVVYKGPGSFTGLRIGLTVANTLAYGQHMPIVGETGDDWIAKGIIRLVAGESDTMILPEYGAGANITKPRS